jgi:hypothetical protein
VTGIHITDIESAINFWRERKPSPDGLTLPEPTRALAQVYAQMVYEHASQVDEARMPPDAQRAWLDWYASTPDTPLHRDLLHQPGRCAVQGLWTDFP